MALMTALMPITFACMQFNVFIDKNQNRLGKIWEDGGIKDQARIAICEFRNGASNDMTCSSNNGWAPAKAWIEVGSKDQYISSPGGSIPVPGKISVRTVALHYISPWGTPLDVYDLKLNTKDGQYFYHTSDCPK